MKQFKSFGRSLAIYGRKFSTRQADDFPFERLVRVKQPFINWKSCGLFLLGGSYLAYSETLFEKYSEYTGMDEKDDILPIQLEHKLKSLPVYQKLAHGKDAINWTKMSSWDNLNRNILESSGDKPKVTGQDGCESPDLINHTLSCPGGILIKPVIFHNHVTNETVTIVHMGYKLCGYPFIIHGGIIATLLNESFKRCASLSTATKSMLKGDFMVNSLEISYKRPLFANQFFVVKTEMHKCLNDDQFILRSVIENEKGKEVVKSKAIITETGRASFLSYESQAMKWALF